VDVFVNTRHFIEAGAQQFDVSGGEYAFSLRST
jgi:hypothetical protein